jgi:DsbC/DsbD-like thiol-disulfide interchange protein
MQLIISLLSLVVLSIASISSASDGPAPKARVELVPSVDRIVPGQAFDLAVVFTIEPLWHLYWLNPGSSGIPPEVKWDLPPGYTVEALEFPAPYRIDDPNGAVTFGFENELVLLARVIPSLSTPEGAEVRLSASVTWLACKDVCVSESASVTTKMAVGVGNSPANQDLHSRARAAMARSIWEDDGASLAAPAVQVAPDQVEWHLTLPAGSTQIDSFAYDSPDSFRSEASVEVREDVVVVRRIFDGLQPNSLTIVTYFDAEGRRHAVRLRPPGSSQDSKPQ